MPEVSKQIHSARKNTWALLAIAVTWLLGGLAICWFAAEGAASGREALKWFVILWGVSVLDLLAIGKTMAAVFNVVGLTGENRIAAIIRASYWGALKLACIGLFIVVLMRASAHPAPGLKLGLVTGVGTMVVVPLTVGFFWSQRILQHAWEP